MKKTSYILSRRTKKFFKLPFSKKLVLFETFFMLGIGRITALLFPIGRIERIVESGNHKCERKSLYKGTDSTECTSEDDPRSMAKIDLVKWSVAVMSRHTPWKSNCFAQALAAHKMLIRRGIPSTLYFGVAKEEEGAMVAHAWLMYTDTVITGENERKRFSTVMQIGCEQK